MTESSGSVAADGLVAPAAPDGFRLTVALILALFVIFAVDATMTALPGTEVAVPWIIGVALTVSLAMIGMVARSPNRQLRFSDPGVLLLLWVTYYFVFPGLSWLNGASFGQMGHSSMLTPDLVVQVQQLHIVFIVVLMAVYWLVLPRFGFRPLTPAQVDELPDFRWLIVIGLLPTVAEVVVRLVQTGSLRPETGYIESVTQQQESLDAAQAGGGLDFVATQLLLKLRLYGKLLLGAGLALYLVRVWTKKSKWGFVAFHASFPALLYLSEGVRSAAVYPYLIALVVTDYLAGPIRWRYILTLILVGYSFFYVYSFFRVHQDEDFATAIRSTISDFGEAQETGLAEAENSLMLVKEVYAINYVEEKGEVGVFTDLKNALILPLPQQLVGEKEQMVSDRITRDLIGDTLFEAGLGLAGSLLAEGYMAGGLLGVIVIAALLALLFGGSIRLLSGLGNRTGTPIWKIMLLAALTSQIVMFVRSELGILISYYLYYMVAPAAVVWLLARRKIGLGRWSFPVGAAFTAPATRPR